MTEVLELNEMCASEGRHSGFSVPLAPGIVAVIPGSPDNELVRLLNAQDLRPGMTLSNYAPMKSWDGMVGPNLAADIQAELNGGPSA